MYLIKRFLGCYSTLMMKYSYKLYNRKTSNTFHKDTFHRDTFHKATFHRDTFHRDTFHREILYNIYIVKDFSTSMIYPYLINYQFNSCFALLNNVVSKFQTAQSSANFLQKHQYQMYTMIRVRYTIK